MKTYKIITLRVERSLAETVDSHCRSNQQSVNSYVIGLLESATGVKTPPVRLGRPPQRPSMSEVDVDGTDEHSEPVYENGSTDNDKVGPSGG